MTAKGIEVKAKVTPRFFKRKIEEYELFNQEIKPLRAEVTESHLFAVE